MANQAISEKNKKGFMILGGAAILVVLVLYFGVIKSPGPAPDVFDQGPEKPIIPEIETDIFKDGTLDSFDVWNSLPVEVGPTGKENPFSR